MSQLVSNNWKELTGYFYEYQINDLGQIRRKMPNGSWKVLKTYSNNNTGTLTINLRVAPNKKKHAIVKYLMDEVFFDGYAKKHGLSITHKNGLKSDCSAYNLQFVTPSELGSLKKYAAKRVAKLDRQGNVVEYYASCKEAAKKNFISTTAVYHRVHNLVQDPYGLDGFDYQFVKDLQ